MSKLALIYYLLALMALENEGLSDECPNCFNIHHNNNHYQSIHIERRPESNHNYNQAKANTPPQYRPIIIAYHPRIHNRQQFYAKNSDHLLDDNPQSLHHESLQQQQQQQPQQSFVRVPQKSVRQRIVNHYWAPVNQSLTINATTAITTSIITTTTSEPNMEELYREPITFTTTTTAKPNYRPRPVSVRIPTNSNRFSNSIPQPSNHLDNNKPINLGENPVNNNIDSALRNIDNTENVSGFGSAKSRRGGRGRKRMRSTTTTTTTTTESPYYDDEDYYDYDQEDYDDYDYQATTTTTTTTKRPGRSRGGRRGGGQPRRRFQQPRPTEPPTTTTTTTLSPNYKPRPDGRIIDYHADPNFPYELKGADLTNYPFYISIPENDFNCKGRHDGYYANIELKCQVYHHCAVGHQRYDFLCPNYTLFDQTTFTCRFVNTVDCEASENHYNRNNELYVESTTNKPELYVENGNRNANHHNQQDQLQTSGSDSSSQININNPEDQPFVRLNKKQMN